jgi:uncharacterized protein involved in outer membrane biogenesis
MVNDNENAPLAAPPRRHRLRGAGVGLLGVLLTLVVVVGICEIVEWPFLRHPLETRLAAALQRPVSFGDDFGVRLIGSVRAHASSMVIGPGPEGAPTLVDEGGKPRDFMRAGRMRMAVGYGTLWQQYRHTGEPLRVRLLDVDDLELNLKRDADGRANWQFGAAQPASAASSPAMPEFERLNVRNGELRIVDVPLQVEADAHVSTHEGSAVAGAGAASAPQLRIATAASAPASGASGAALAAADDAPGLRVDGKGTYRKAPLLLQLRSSGVMPIASSEIDAPPVPVWLDVHSGTTRIRLDGSATDVLHFGGLDARFDAAGPSLAAVGDALGVTLPTTARFSTHGRLRKHGAAWDAAVEAMDIGSSRLHGDFRFDTAPAVPVLSGKLRGTRFALVDLGPAFGAATPDIPKTTKAGDRVLPAREFDIPSLRAMNANVDVALDVVDLGTDKLEPFRPLQGRITLDGGVLALHDLLARTSAGQVQGSIGLDSRPALPKWNADLRWAGIQLDRFVKARDIAAPKNADGQRSAMGYISGALGGNAQLRGEGRSTAQLLASLDGSARMWVRDGKVSHLLIEATGIDIAQALGVFIKGDDALPMQCAVTQLVFVNGKVMPEVGVIDTRDTTLVVGGELSLANESLDLRMTAHPHDFSPLALRAPVDVKGTFSDPHIRLEAKPLMARGAAAAALALAAPLASLLALADFRQPEKDVCTTAIAHLTNAPKAALSASSPAPSRAGRTPTAPAHGR